MQTVLVISFTDIAKDARVRRQVDLLGKHYTVITAGHGEAMPGVHQHIELPQPLSGRARRLRMIFTGVMFRLRAYRVVHATDAVRRAGIKALRGVHADAVIANDIEAAPLAFSLSESGKNVHLDLHEFFPGIHDDNPRWAAGMGMYFEWQIRKYGPRAASTTTVAAPIAQLYEAYGLSPSVVSNAPHFREGTPHQTGNPIRIVHSGAALADRGIEAIMRAVAASDVEAVLTLHLMPNDPSHLAYLQELAIELGDRVRVESPVPYAALLDTLAQHDVGIHVLPATSTNNRLALPNKFFDYIQARLGVIVGPTPSMAAIVRERGLGVVADDFTSEAITNAISNMTPALVDEWKAAADRAAHVLTASTEAAKWLAAVDGITGRQ